MSSESLRDQDYGTRLTLRKIYELATSGPLMGWSAFNEMAALRQLAATLGPLPEEWVVSLGMSGYS